MSRKANPTLIGSFVLGGVFLSVVAVLVFGSGRMFRDTSPFISFFDGSISGLDVGASVRFRGIDVGEVTEVLIDLPGVERAGEDVRIAVIYELDRQQVESRGAGVRLADPLAFDTLIGLGIHAELASESLVTGRKYIALDLDPGSPIDFDPVPGAPHPEIPTVNTGLERLEEEVYGLIAELGAVRLDSLINTATEAFSDIGELARAPEITNALEGLPATIGNLNRTISDLQMLVANVDSTLVPIREGVVATTAQATSTMQQLESTLEEVGGVLKPESPVFVHFEQAMIDLSEASRALRNLADYLERNPSAILRGRPGGDR